MDKELKIVQSPTFDRFVKKQTRTFKTKLDHVIKEIQQDPTIGEQKRGDLQEIRVYKFKEGNSLYLLGYRETLSEIQLIMIGTHENYYRDIKRYIKK